MLLTILFLFSFITGIIIPFIFVYLYKRFGIKERIDHFIEHNRSWSFMAFVVALYCIVLFFNGGIYATVGMLIAVLEIVFLTLIYYNLYCAYEELNVYVNKLEAERKKILFGFDEKKGDT